MELIIALALSALFGYVAGKLMGLEGQWYVYVLLGLAGGFVGSLLFGLIGFESRSLISDAIVSIIGACVVIFLYRKLKK
ncbi:MAG: GlsB/YeaQ/YmgE family stress response membrane protein [Erysipelotrichaceae bacterium]|nr:GlsB/YeaQ/YmgE family stress response membrane protein [Erysipelotrichaceae bacterium]